MQLLLNQKNLLKVKKKLSELSPGKANLNSSEALKVVIELTN